MCPGAATANGALYQEEANRGLWQDTATGKCSTPALILAIIFFSGINLFFLGIIGEYVGRTYEEAKARPHYVVLKIVDRRGLVEPAGLPTEARPAESLF